jgi:hypothetical protein
MCRLFSAAALLLAAGLAVAGETTCELTPAAQVPVAADQRTRNKSGVQCVWCSLATLGKYHGHAGVAALAEHHKGLAGPAEVRAALGGLGVRYRMQMPGNKDPKILRDACARRWGAAVGLGGTHAVNVIHFAGGTVKLVDNSDPALADRTLTEAAFLARWDGWAVVLTPPAEDAP